MSLPSTQWHCEDDKPWAIANRWGLKYVGFGRKSEESQHADYCLRSLATPATLEDVSVRAGGSGATPHTARPSHPASSQAGVLIPVMVGREIRNTQKSGGRCAGSYVRRRARIDRPRLTGHAETLSGRVVGRSRRHESKAQLMRMDQDATPEALKILRFEHLALEGLFRRYFDSIWEADRLRLLRSLCREVYLHYTAETGVFVPACARALADPSILHRGGADYAVVTALIVEIDASAADGFRVESHIAELNQCVNEHIEAQDGPAGLFELVRQSDLGWEVLEKVLIVRRHELSSRYGSFAA